MSTITTYAVFELLLLTVIRSISRFSHTLGGRHVYNFSRERERVVQMRDSGERIERI